MFRRYATPETTGWLGWFENADGIATAFVNLTGQVVLFDAETLEVSRLGIRD